MIVINNIGHSGFSVESETHMLIFDYSEGKLPSLAMKKKLYVFVSHSHSDHYNPEVFRLCREHPAVKFVLSSDIPRSEVESHGVFDYISADPGTDIKLESKFRLKALPSTDLGVAFLCCLDGRNIYHAGDLNLWLWEGRARTTCGE